MGKIHLNLPVNSFHANILRKEWKEVLMSGDILDAIRESKVPISMSYHVIDTEMWPWLKKIGNCSNIEKIRSTFSHTLIPMLNSQKVQKWEVENGIKGNVPVTFFSEFYTPEESKIPNGFFFVLEGQTYLYSSCFPETSDSDIETETFPKDVLGINYADKIGIIMRNTLFAPILNAFFLFQRDPFTIREETKNKNPLTNILDKIEEIGNMPNNILVVMPIDFEAPFIGSAFGADIWKMFFQGIVNRGLKDVFTPINSELNKIKNKSVRTKQPHRDIAKWNSNLVQHRYWMSLAKINPVTHREKVLYSIASCSDIFACWERKIGETKKKIVLRSKNKQREQINIPISFNQDIIEIQIAARNAIVDSVPFIEKLDKLKNKSIFVKRVIGFAKKYDL